MDWDQLVRYAVVLAFGYILGLLDMSMHYSKKEKK